MQLQRVDVLRGKIDALLSALGASGNRHCSVTPPLPFELAPPSSYPVSCITPLSCRQGNSLTAHLVVASHHQSVRTLQQQYTYCF